MLLRARKTATDSTHFVAGWNLNSALTWSRNKIEEQCVGGYAKGKEYPRHVGQSLLDPFAAIGGQSDAIKTLIANSLFHGSIREASTTLKGADLPASHELFALGPERHSWAWAQIIASIITSKRRWRRTPKSTTSTLWRPST